MQCVPACILLLTLGGPFFVNSEKVVLLVPHQIRRSPLSRPPHIHQAYLKRSHYSGPKYRPHGPHSTVHYGKPKQNFHKSKLPLGGDDFEPHHDNVNHVIIPHGKGISHGISYGRGYIPYDKIKGDIIRPNEQYRNQENRPAATYQHSSVATRPEHLNPVEYAQPDPYFTEDKGVFGDLPFSDKAKFINLRSIDNDQYSNTVTPNVNNDAYYKEPEVPQENVAPVMHVGSEGIVIRDTVLLDDYTRKIEEFTKSWPKIVGFVSAQAPASSVGQLVPSNLPYGSVSLPFIGQVAQGRQGYDVREDVDEGPTSNFQHTLSAPLVRGQTSTNVGVSSLISVQG